jgi:arylsulfatase A-like enzyme
LVHAPRALNREFGYDLATEGVAQQSDAPQPHGVHPGQQSLGQAGPFQSPYHDTMVDHDKNVGALLKALDDLGIADNTFVMYSTDNGPHMNSWPDAAMTPFRGEKKRQGGGSLRQGRARRSPGLLSVALLGWAASAREIAIFRPLLDVVTNYAH